MSQVICSNGKRIPELDGLRAFAVAGVVICHMQNFSHTTRGPYWIAEVVTCLGPVGVDIFFVISGFIITTLLIREKVSVGNVSLTNFYIRRFFRIVPPFGVYLIALVVIREFGVVIISSKDLFRSALFLGDMTVFDEHYWLIGHTWSLSVEEQFYLLFPPLLCVVLAFRERITFLVLCALYALCFVSRELAGMASLYFSPLFGNVGALYNFRYIIVGVIFAIYGHFVLKFISKSSRMLPISLGALIILSHLLEAHCGGMSVSFGALEPCICGLFVMWFVQNPSRCAPLRWRVVQWIGSCSYSIYIWQQLFTGPDEIYGRWNLGKSPFAFLAIIGCATASHYIVERPGIRLGRFACERRASREANSVLKQKAEVEVCT